jgi:hypothetical protein
MIIVDYPKPSFRIRKEKEAEFIFDSIRKRWVLLSEEEWVRQNFINYLVRVMDYPSTMIAVEKEIRLGELKKRFDILIYNSAHRPWMLVECKAPSALLNQPVLEQILRYNIGLPADFLVITNGNTTYGWQKTSSGLQLIEKLPFAGSF